MFLLPLNLLACGPSQLTIGERPDPDDTGELPDTDDTIEDLPDNGDTDDSDDTDEDLTDEEIDAIYNAFFDPTVIQTVDIVLSDRAIRALNRGAEEYQEGDVTINGELFPSVGVRLKGSSTWQDLDCGDGYCKGAFKIKLNEFVAGQKYGDLERITLNNMTSDYTQSKEIIVYDLLNRHTQLASRASYARVTLNGEPWGLYANIESADDHWLERRFGDATGNFWGTADYYGDFYQPYYDTGWVLKSGGGEMTEIDAVTQALDRYTGDFFGELGPVINVDQWLEYWAWCATVGNFDGYPFTLNDFLIYADPLDEGRFVFAPWGTDESFDQYEYSGRSWDLVGGRLGLACMADVNCLAELKMHIDGAITKYEATDVLSIAEAAWDLSEADVQTDPTRPFTPQDVFYYRSYYEGVIPTYGDYVRGRVGL
jgi:hypothetical protein